MIAIIVNTASPSASHGRRVPRAVSLANQTDQTNRTDRTRREVGRGFTLAELVIVVLIIGIMAAAAVPQFSKSLQFFRADAAAKRVKMDLELARRRAKMTSASQTVSFDLNSNSYSLPGVPHLDHPSLDYQVNLEKSPYNGKLSSANFGGDATVVFDGFGAADSAGTVTVNSGPYSKTISLDATTGKVTIQ